MELLRAEISRGRIGEISSPEFGLGISGVLWEAQDWWFFCSGTFSTPFPCIRLWLWWEILPGYSCLLQSHHLWWGYCGLRRRLESCQCEQLPWHSSCSGVSESSPHAGSRLRRERQCVTVDSSCTWTAPAAPVRAAGWDVVVQSFNKSCHFGQLLWDILLLWP